MTASQAGEQLSPVHDVSDYVITGRGTVIPGDDVPDYVIIGRGTVTPHAWCAGLYSFAGEW
jgi:hypothetical protein